MGSRWPMKESTTPEVREQQEMLTMLTSYVQDNREDYAKAVYELVAAPLSKKIEELELIIHGMEEGAENWRTRCNDLERQLARTTPEVRATSTSNSAVTCEVVLDPTPEVNNDHHWVGIPNQFEGVIVKHNGGSWGDRGVQTQWGGFALTPESLEYASNRVGQQVKVRPRKEYYRTVEIIRDQNDPTPEVQAPQTLIDIVRQEYDRLRDLKDKYEGTPHEQKYSYKCMAVRDVLRLIEQSEVQATATKTVELDDTKLLSQEQINLNEMGIYFGYPEWIRLIESEVSELESIEGELVQVRQISSCAIALRFKNGNAYWLSIQKQGHVTLD